MSKDLLKNQKITTIDFDETSPLICVRTYNTNLKKRLIAYSETYPDICKLTEDNQQGCLSFEIEKCRFAFRLTKPYSKQRREAARKTAIDNNYAERLNSARRAAAERRRAKKVNIAQGQIL